MTKKDKPQIVRSNLLFTLALAILVFLPIASAETTDLGTFSQDVPVILPQTCSNCTYINVTRVIYPDSSWEVINKPMSQLVNGNYNYTFTNTTMVGNYIATTCGNPDGVFQCQDYRFHIGNLAIYVLLTLLIGGYVLLFFSAYFKIPITGFASGSFLVVAGIYMTIYGFGLIKDRYTLMLGLVTFFIGLAAAFSASYEFFAEATIGGEELDDD